MKEKKIEIGEIITLNGKEYISYNYHKEQMAAKPNEVIKKVIKPKIIRHPLDKKIAKMIDELRKYSSKRSTPLYGVDVEWIVLDAKIKLLESLQ
jgi:uncharacterized protein YlzI (FlbEa/FlbD family)